MDYTVNDLQYKGLTLIQPKHGYRHNEDSLILLSHILSHYPRHVVRSGFEFGTGSGIISLLLAAKRPHISITAVEIQSALYEIARRNIEQKNIEKRVKIICADGCHYSLDSHNKVDFSFSNPPYYVLGEGKMGDNPQRNAARHEVFCTMKDVFECLARVTKPGGDFFVIYPFIRFNDFLNLKKKAWQPVSVHFYKNIREKIISLPYEEVEKIHKNSFKNSLFVAQLQRQ